MDDVGEGACAADGYVQDADVRVHEDTGGVNHFFGQGIGETDNWFGGRVVDDSVGAGTLKALSNTLSDDEYPTLAPVKAHGMKARPSDRSGRAKISGGIQISPDAKVC
jgi:hypothetical protein